MARTARIPLLAATVAVLGAPGAADAGRPPPQFYISSTSSNAENFGPARVVVSRTGNIKKAGSVTLTPTQISGTDALVGVDFDGTSFFLTFARNQSSREVFVPYVDDTVAESDEDFRLELSAPSVGVVGPPSVVTIIDDDQPGLFTVPDGDVLTAEGTLDTCNPTSASVIDSSGTERVTLGLGGTCAPEAISGTWTNATGSPVVVKVRLVDRECDAGYVYYSDHTGTGIEAPSEAGVFDHAAAWSGAVMVNDSGGSCVNKASASQPGTGATGNLDLWVTVTTPEPV